MSYEIIALENGDILDRLSDYDEAVHVLRMYIETHRASIPGIEHQVGLLELDDADEPHGEYVMYSDISQHISPRTATA
jgi:hypothetical protein